MCRDVFCIYCKRTKNKLCGSLNRVQSARMLNGKQTNYVPIYGILELYVPASRNITTFFPNCHGQSTSAWSVQNSRISAPVTSKIIRPRVSKHPTSNCKLESVRNLTLVVVHLFVSFCTSASLRVSF
jgi:hypothetical protein